MCLIMLVVRRAAVAPASLLTGDSRKVVLAFAVWIGMALLAALLSGHGLVETREIGRIGPFVLMPLVFLSVVSLPERWLDRALHAFVLVLVLACTVAIAQYCLNLLRENRLAESLIALLLKGSQSRVPDTNDELVAGGFYRHRLKMAHVVLLGIAVLLGRQLLVSLRPRQRGIEIGILVLFFVTLLLTFTRGAILGIGAAVAVTIWLGTPRWRMRAMIAVVLITAAGFSVPAVRQRVASIGVSSTGSDRAFIWAQAVQIVGDHRLGIGLANYPTWAAAYYEEARSPYNLPLTYPHSLVMGAWAEAGPVGLGGYVAMWLALAMAGVGGLRRRDDTRLLTAGSALLLVTVALWVVGITHDVLFHKPVALTFAAIVGACLAQFSRDAGERVVFPEDGVARG
jgi:O-antigen ligase